MKKLLMTLAVMSLMTGIAFGQNNEIGIYTTQDANPENTAYNGGAFVQFQAYVVVTNPFDTNNGQPISQIGGFEFHVTVPANVTVLGWNLPPLTTNFATPPDILAGSNTPVVGGAATVLTLNCFPMAATPGVFSLTPVTNTPQSVPGEMAITNYNNDFRISVVYPVSGAHDAPVFGFNTGVVPTEDASGGDVKSLFR